ncbi:MAG: 3-hydroxyacyl-ACP dehydratase FabZ [Chlamydiales bacterium]|jgi:3-hydroxyacyl-[acyl-carrier-protein] dehydratase|nr:3-hydroxyacyl-ACP dehydratase FabZ [Chlamydiales bacterium]
MNEVLSEQNTVLNVKQIAKILPHRYPFLLVDKIVHLNLKENHIVGHKNISFNEHFFQGHFPDAPIMPGVLVIEAMAQTAGVLIYKKGYQEKTAVLLNIQDAKFRKPVEPGDTLIIDVRMLHLSGSGGKILAHASVQEKGLVTEARIGFALLDKDQLYKD